MGRYNPVVEPITFNVADYGAVGDGIHDDTSAIQATISASQVPLPAIAAASLSSSAIVFFPPGTYLISSTILLPPKTALVGAGWTSIIQAANSLNAYMIALQPLSGSPYYCFGSAVRNMLIAGNCTHQTSGGGIDGHGAVQCEFEFVNFDSCYEAAIKLRENNDSSFGHHNKIHDCLFSNGGNSAGDGQGILMVSTDENFIYSNDFEAMGGSGSNPYAIRDMAGLQLIQGNVFVNGVTAILQKDTTNGDRIIGNMFDGCGGHGIRIDNCSRTIISGNYFDGMGSLAAATYDCINVPTGSNFLTIANNFFRSNATAGQTKWFIEISDTGAATNVTIIGNTFVVNGTLGNASAASGGVVYMGNSMASSQIIGNSFSTTGNSVFGYNSGDINLLSIKDNIGMLMEATGTATVAAGNTSVTVTYPVALGFTPSLSRGDVQVTPTSVYGSAAKFWVSAVTATTLTINVDAAPGGAGMTFSWSVTRYRNV